MRAIYVFIGPCVSRRRRSQGFAVHVADAPSLQDSIAVIGAYAMHQPSRAMCILEIQAKKNCAAIAERASAATLDDGIVDLLVGSRS